MVKASVRRAPMYDFDRKIIHLIDDSKTMFGCIGIMQPCAGLGPNLTPMVWFGGLKC